MQELIELFSYLDIFLSFLDLKNSRRHLHRSYYTIATKRKSYTFRKYFIVILEVTTNYTYIIHYT